MEINTVLEGALREGDIYVESYISLSRKTPCFKRRVSWGRGDEEDPDHPHEERGRKSLTP
jgi:hypothetical protein